MLDQVTSTTVISYEAQLTGEQPVMLSDGPYTITTRYTDSGTPIQKALQFVEEHLVGLGYSVENQAWSLAGYSNVNVIGERTGATNPSDIYIIGAHLDAQCWDARFVYCEPAPGSDDNASGSVAVLIAADILSQYEWGCTLRFAFWTGEEQGWLGSSVYAARSKMNGEHVKGYLNLDSIAFNAHPPQSLSLWWKSTVPASQRMADLFIDVVSAYGLDLWPGKLDAVDFVLANQCDSAPFWDQGYPSIWVSEDINDANAPIYHSSRDRMSALDMGYLTTMVKAVVGTFAHMSGCLIEPLPTETPTSEPPSPTLSETPTATHTVTPIPSATPSGTPTVAPSATPPPSATPMSDGDGGGCAITPVRSGSALWWLLVPVLALWVRRGDRAGRAEK